jgi:hypothetical protein
MDPKELLQNPEQIKNLISILQALLPEELPQKTKQKTRKKLEKNSEQIEESVFNTNIKTKNKKTINAQLKNKFESMSEFSMHKDDCKLDQKLNKQPPVARTREFDPITVTCRICSKKETVSPLLVSEGPARYKCNNCSTQAG